MATIRRIKLNVWYKAFGQEPFQQGPSNSITVGPAELTGPGGLGSIVNLTGQAATGGVGTITLPESSQVLLGNQAQVQ